LTYRWYSDTVGIAMAVRMTRQESTAATRAELLDAARHVFVERGYHGASLELVAREAGYTKGAVYSAFGSKGGLFLAVYEREVDDRWTRIEREVTERITAHGRVDFGAEAARDYFARLRLERAWSITLLEFRLHASRDPRLNAAYAQAHRRVVDRLAGLLARNFDADRDALVEVALALMALSNGYALEHLALPGEATEARYIAAGSALVSALLDRRS
jgi:AcrR family transcriptional regulator